MPVLCASADDRTGSLEVGGLLASPGQSIKVGRFAEDPICAVVDTDSRHVSTEEAFERVINVHKSPSQHHCHKMDAGLRGNWPDEALAFVELGFKVAIVPSFPDAGRRCQDGVVYIDDVPVLESPFGQDPFSAPCSSRPIDVLEEADCVHNDIVIWDANDNDALDEAVDRCIAEGRVMIGPAGALGFYGSRFLSEVGHNVRTIKPPVLVVCGSLNNTSRSQIEALEEPTFTLEDELPLSEDWMLVKTPDASGPIESSAALEMSQKVSQKVHQTLDIVSTYLLIGGDTVAGVVGDDTLETIGTVDIGIPISKWGEHYVISKGGGIGKQQTLRQLRSLVTKGN